MLFAQLLFGDEVNCGVVIGEIVGHLFDLALDAGEVRPLFGDDVALARVLFSRGQNGILAAADALERAFDGNGVLAGVLDPLDAADGVAVPLADALAPKGVGAAVRHDRAEIDARQREQARIPADAHGAEVACLFGGSVQRLKIFGDAGVGIEAVYRVEQLHDLRRLRGQVCRAAAAEDHHVDLADVFAHGVIPFHLDGQNRLHGGGVSAGEYRHDLHIFVLRRSVLYAAAQIAVTDNADPDFIHNCLLTRRFYLI